jgi:hypothetical protein
MPRFFFDTFDGSRYIYDDAGLKMESLEAAKSEAQRALSDLARDALPNGDQSAFIVQVKDETGQVVFRATLSLIVEQIERKDINGETKKPRSG